jgi:hypothetical protein
MRDTARRIFIYASYLLVASVIVQVLLAGLGVFQSSEWFFWHANVNSIIVFFLPIVMLIIGIWAGLTRRVVLLTAAVPVLVIFQSLFLIPYHLNAHGLLRAIAGLHVVNAFAIFYAAMLLLDQTRQMQASRAR